jgi:GDPmannose 4,6-dehydratase
MLQASEPDDFVLATNKKISVRKFIELSFNEVGVQIEWTGAADQEKGVDKKTGKILVEIDPKYYRPTEVDLLIGDYSKAKNILGWEPKYSVEDLLKEMVKSDVELFKRDKYLLEGGHKVMNFHE